MVSGYFLVKAGRRALRPLAVYWIVSAMVSYVTWPFLWDAPIRRFWESLSVMANFASHRVLYRGVIYPAAELPWHYFPGLAAVQLTEPVVILSALGFLVGLAKAWARRVEWPALALIVTWVGLPLIAVVALHTPLYGNSRQLYFAIPPVFVFAGIGLAAILDRMRPISLRLIAIGLVLAPGLVGIVRLHPYEYSFYNSFVGGVDGAYRRYELDHWCTAYREAMVFVNAVAPANASVAVWGPVSAASPFAREDLKVSGTSASDPDFAIGCKWAVLEKGFFPDLDVVFEVKRGRGVFAVVKMAR
jgi:hypothetical protein